MTFLRTGPHGILGPLVEGFDINGMADKVIVPATALMPAPISTTGKNIASAASSAYSLIPRNAAGNMPTRLRIASTAAAFVKLGYAVDMSAAVSAAGSGYSIGDSITLTGGTAANQMVLNVASVKIISAAVNAAGTGYVPADTITLAGGTHSVAGILAVATTKVVSATIANAGTGGTPGAATVTGTTGTGTKFQAAVTIEAGGTISAVGSITVAGSYTVNPTDLTVEPVTGGGLTGATLALGMGAATLTVSNAGAYTVVPTTFTQASTSGSGTGATINTVVYGVKTVTVTSPGDYTAEPSNAVAQGSSSGGGTSATFNVIWAPAAAAGDILVQPGDSVILDAASALRLAAVRVSADGVVNIIALDW